MGTGSNVLATLLWSGSTNGMTHSGAIVGIQPNFTYSTFIKSVDVAGNVTTTPVRSVLFTQSATGTQFVSSGGGGGGGGSLGGGGGSGGSSITIGTSGITTVSSSPVPAATAQT